MLSAVSEPSRCLYAAKLTTPAMCTKEELDRLQVCSLLLTSTILGSSKAPALPYVTLPPKTPLPVALAYARDHRQDAEALVSVGVLHNVLTHPLK